MTIKRRDLITGAAALAAYAGMTKEVQALPPQRFAAIFSKISASFFTPGGTMPYFGQVATLARVPNQINASFTQMMSRRRHIMKVAVASFKILLSNFYVKQSQTVNNELTSGGSATFTAAIEYPQGTFTQVTFGGGNTSATVASGSLQMSDPINLSIPAGTAFWVRIFFTGASGIIYTDTATTTNGAIEDLSNGDAFTFAASGLTDQTMGGTVVNTSGNGRFCLSATAILGMTSQPSVFAMGDSRTGGQEDAPNDASGDIGETCRAIGKNWAYINAGVAFGSINGWLTGTNVRQLYIASFCSHVVSEYGEVDVANLGRSAANIVKDIQAARNCFGEKPFFQTTLIQETTSTDSWASLVNQTVINNDSVRQTLNGLIRAGITDVTGFFDNASVLESGSTGKWIVNGSANYATADGIHETPAANALIRDAGLYTSAKIHL